MIHLQKDNSVSSIKEDLDNTTVAEKAMSIVFFFFPIQERLNAKLRQGWLVSITELGQYMFV